MRRILMPAVRLLGDQRGVTSLEYGMMIALIALVIFSAVARVGTKALSLWTTASTLPY